MASEEENPTHREVLWRQYASSVDLYKHYTEIALKTNAFFYVTTTGIVTYYLASADNAYIKWALILPISMGFILGIGFIYGAHLLKAQREDILFFREKLRLDLKAELGILGPMFLLSGMGFILVGIILIVLFFSEITPIKKCSFLLPIDALVQSLSC